MNTKINPHFKALLPLGRSQNLRFALVKYGGGIVQMSGSVAGNVHARNRFGNYMRARTKPVNPMSDRQVVARTRVSYLAEYWSTDLTALQRAGWETYAAAVAMTNKLGETIHLTGFNHFLRTNCANMQAGPGVSENAPLILSLPEKDYQLTCSAETIAGQLFTFTCDNAGWAANGDPKIAIFLYVGKAQLASRNFFGGPWRYMDYIDAVDGAAGTGTYVSPFSFALGQKVWFQARVLTESKRLSEIWTLAPRVIEADV